MKDFEDLGKQILESLDDLKKIILNAETSQESEKKPRKRFEQKDNIKLDNLEQKLIIADKEIQLTYKEWAILREILNSENKICTYEDFAKNLYECEADEYVKNSLRVATSRIQQKTKGLIEIINIRNVGYYIKEVKQDERAD